MIDWLLLPLSGAAAPAISDAHAWHARLMVLGWGLVVPCGVLIARYWKVTPQQNWPHTLDSKVWWRSHLAAANVVAFCTIVGFALVVNSAPKVFSALPLSIKLHHLLGYAVMVLCIVQILLGLLRGGKGGPTSVSMRGDHYDMSPRRILFERVHKSCGWLAIALSIGAIVSGLVHSDAPRWMFFILLVWWSALIGAAIIWQRRGQCLDTYQAIWGPDPIHPGNHPSLKPTGWGITRKEV